MKKMFLPGTSDSTPVLNMVSRKRKAAQGIHRCDHIGILTNDAQRLIRFYTKKLDFRKIKEDVLDASTFGIIFGFSVSTRFIKLSTDGLMLELFEPLKKKARSNTMNTTGLNHFGYCVKNRRDYVKRLQKKKVKIIEIKRNGHTVYFVSDPDGNRIEIRECVKQHTSRKKGGKHGPRQNKSW